MSYKIAVALSALSLLTHAVDDDLVDAALKAQEGCADEGCSSDVTSLQLLQRRSEEVEELERPGAELHRETSGSSNGIRWSVKPTDAATIKALQMDGDSCGNGVMGFRLANITRNNLGGQGPDVGQDLEEGIFIANVFPDSGRDISLVLNAKTDYSPHRTDKTGLWKKGEFMQINVRCGTEVDVQFSFVDSETLELVKVPDFYMTFYDLDEMKKGAGREYLSVPNNIKSAQLSDTTVVTQEGGPDDKITFHSTKFGNRGDNPTHPRDLTKDQEDKAVSLFFPSSAQFTVTWGASNAPKQQRNGRNILFSGASTLSCPRVAMCNSAQCPEGYEPKKSNELIACNADTCDMETSQDRDRCCDYAGLCDNEQRMNFDISTVSRNNLGKQGPEYDKEEGIMYDNVFPESGRRINLLMNAESDYTRVDPYNGLNKEKSIGRVNMKLDTSTNLSFSFIDAESGAPVEVGPFAMTFLDFDEDSAPRPEGAAREYLTIRGLSSYSLTDETMVSVIGAGNGAATFRSTVFGIGKDNAKEASKMTLEQMRKSVVVAFPKLSSFQATFRIGGLPDGWQAKYGRNIDFAGFTNMICNDDVLLKESLTGGSNRLDDTGDYTR